MDRRAWCVAGQAIRFGIALGLHLMVSPEAIDRKHHEQRCRLWYSLYRLEILLSEQSGRPKCITTSCVTLPLELLSRHNGQRSDRGSPYEDSRALWYGILGTYSDVATAFEGGTAPWHRRPGVGTVPLEQQFMAGINLSRISDTISNDLYLQAASSSWLEVQNNVKASEKSLQAYRDTLLPAISMHGIYDDNPDIRSQLELDLYRCSVQMILYRPFLCHIVLEGQSKDSHAFNQRCARGCVEAATDCLNLIPDQPVAHLILRTLPWWSLLHYICQAGSVLLLELCLNTVHMQGESQLVITPMVKVMAYLECLSSDSKSAYRAWTIFRSLLDRAMRRYRTNLLKDLPEMVQRPGRWTQGDEDVMQATRKALL